MLTSIYCIICWLTYHFLWAASAFRWTPPEKGWSSFPLIALIASYSTPHSSCRCWSIQIIRRKGIASLSTNIMTFQWSHARPAGKEENWNLLKGHNRGWNMYFNYYFSTFLSPLQILGWTHTWCFDAEGHQQVLKLTVLMVMMTRRTISEMMTMILLLLILTLFVCECKQHWQW